MQCNGGTQDNASKIPKQNVGCLWFGMLYLRSYCHLSLSRRQTRSPRQRCSFRNERNHIFCDSSSPAVPLTMSDLRLYDSKFTTYLWCLLCAITTFINVTSFPNSLIQRKMALNSWPVLSVSLRWSTAARQPGLPLTGVRAYYTRENLTKTPKIRWPGVRVRPK